MTINDTHPVDVASFLYGQMTSGQITWEKGTEIFDRFIDTSQNEHAIWAKKHFGAKRGPRFCVGQKSLERCWEYAYKEKAPRSYRDKINNDSHPGRLPSSVCGKLGEMGVWILHNTTQPDFNIYKRGELKYEPDVLNLDNGDRCHVKACSLKEKRESDSWLVSPRDKVVVDPQPNDYYYFVYADKTGCGYVEMVGKVLATEITSDMWKPTRNTKIPKNVLYYDDIQHLIRPFGPLRQKASAALCA